MSIWLIIFIIICNTMLRTSISILKNMPALLCLLPKGPTCTYKHIQAQAILFDYGINIYWRLLPQFLFQLRLGSHSHSINIIKPIEFVGTMQFVIYISLLFRHKGFLELLAAITFQIITKHLTTVNTKHNTLFSEMSVHFISDISRYSNKHISCSNMQRYVDIHR